MEVVVFFDKKNQSSINVIKILKQRNYIVTTIEVTHDNIDIIKKYQIKKIPTILTTDQKYSGAECNNFIKKASPIISNNFNSKLNENQVTLNEEFRIDTPSEYNDRIGNSNILNPYGLLGQKLTSLQEDLSSFAKDNTDDKLAQLQKDRQ